MWLWVYYDKIPIYSIFSLLKGDYMHLYVALRVTPSIECYRVGAVPNFNLSSTGAREFKPIKITRKCNVLAF